MCVCVYNIDVNHAYGTNLISTNKVEFNLNNKKKSVENEIIQTKKNTGRRVQGPRMTTQYDNHLDTLSPRATNQKKKKKFFFSKFTKL